MLIRLIMSSSAEIGTQENSRGTRELTPVNSGQLTTIRQSITTLVKLCPSRSGTPLGANRLSGSRDSNDPQTSGSHVRRWCGTSLLVMAPSLFQRFLARPYGRRQIKNSFGLRASLLHHFHQHFPSFHRIAYLPQECNASTAHAIGRFQADMKTEAIDCCHGGFC